MPEKVVDPSCTSELRELSVLAVLCGEGQLGEDVVGPPAKVMVLKLSDDALVEVELRALEKAVVLSKSSVECDGYVVTVPCDGSCLTETVVATPGRDVLWSVTEDVVGESEPGINGKVVEPSIFSEGWELSVGTLVCAEPGMLETAGEDSVKRVVR